MNVGRTIVRLLHTSDLHLGEEFGSDHRLAGLRAVVDAAVDQKVDALLVAGDFFDNGRVPDLGVEAVLQELRRLTIPAIIVPGNHDCLDHYSIYHRVSLREASEHIHFMDEPAGSHATFEHLKLAVWAKPILDHNPDHKPLEGYRPGGAPGYWQVALVHGHFVPTGEPTDRSSPIREEELALLGCDYVALGHWHRFLDITANGVPAFYCGSPSESGSSFASANLVTLDPAGGARIERIPLGSYSSRAPAAAELGGTQASS